MRFARDDSVAGRSPWVVHRVSMQRQQDPVVFHLFLSLLPASPTPVFRVVAYRKSALWLRVCQPRTWPPPDGTRRPFPVSLLRMFA
jgi:hypothetical protein